MSSTFSNTDESLKEKVRRLARPSLLDYSQKYNIQSSHFEQINFWLLKCNLKVYNLPV